MNWIKTSEQMPEAGNWYIVFERGQVNFLFYESENIWLCSLHNKEADDCVWTHEITHWMPLPPNPNQYKQ